MLGENDNWPQKIDDLKHIDQGLNKKEKEYLSKTLNKKALNLFMNLRYAPDPLRFDKMTKKELLYELKYSRYE